jgi:membrane associated rhomboid family serine protease
METTTGNIRVRSRRRAMDWSLVLLSQGIESTILRTEDDAAWALQVDPAELARAEAVLRAYETENRSWEWRQRIPASPMLFHWGAAIWCALLGLAHAAVFLTGIKREGMFYSSAVRAGEWWRTITAITLHADAGHLAANLSVGLLFLGLAMAHFGFGLAPLAALLAGAAGNLVAFALDPRGHHSLGASGMMLGTLGLVAVQAVSLWRRWHGGGRATLAGLVAGGMLFLIFGASPDTDWAAHLGGFLAGCGLGLLLMQLPETLRRSGTVNWLATLASLLLVTLAWMLALTVQRP